MSFPIDKITRQKLALTKQLFRHAEKRSHTAYTALNRLLSILEFDLAIETVLKAAYTSLDPGKQPPDTFQPLLNQCDSLLSKEGLEAIPDKPTIQYVHSLRNDAQHKLKYPSQRDVDECRGYTRDFLAKITAVVWGVKFEDISLADLIENEGIRDALVSAEQSVRSGDYLAAIDVAGDALVEALGEVRPTLVGSDISALKGIRKRLAESADPNQEFLDAFHTVQETLLFVSLGINLVEFDRFERTMYRIAKERVAERAGGEPVRVDANEAEYVVGFCIETVLATQEILGTLDGPLPGRRGFLP